VEHIKINGVHVGECNPDGGDYDCTFYDCQIEHSFYATSNELEIEMKYKGHSRDCDCDKSNWQCSTEDAGHRRRRSYVAGRTPVEAVARFTLTQVTPNGQIFMFWKEGTGSLSNGNSDSAYETVTRRFPVTYGAKYDVLAIDVLRNDMGSSSERVQSIKIDGVNLGSCNPDGSDYDCTFFDCLRSFTENGRAWPYSFTATSNEIEVSLRFKATSWDCDCDTTDWECSKQNTNPWSNAQMTSMEGVARITMAQASDSVAEHAAFTYRVLSRDCDSTTSNQADILEQTLRSCEHLCTMNATCTAIGFESATGRCLLKAYQYCDTSSGWAYYTKEGPYIVGTAGAACPSGYDHVTSDSDCKGGAKIVGAEDPNESYSNRGGTSCGVCVPDGSSCCNKDWVTLDGWSTGNTCYMPLCKKARIFSCATGQIQIGGSTLFTSTDGSKEACAAKCNNAVGCDAFDYAEGSCRGVLAGQTPALGDNADNRKYCSEVACPTSEPSYDTAKSGGFFEISDNTVKTTGQFCSVLYSLAGRTGKVYLEFTKTENSAYGAYVGVQRAPEKVGNYHDKCENDNGNCGSNARFAATELKEAPAINTMMIDLDAGTATCNGVEKSIAGTGELWFAVYDGTSSGTGSVTINWGADMFAYALPADTQRMTCQRAGNA